MKHGSVLIVVLGLLAILALVGITFVTMSNLDRRTAANFALQSQFMLSADAAVDYVCYHLVQDLWQYDAATGAYRIDDRLLNDSNNAQPAPRFARNEPFDYPGGDFDPWLSTTPEGESIPSTGYISYSQAPPGFTQFCGTTHWYAGTPADQRPNNLGYPDSFGTNPRIPIFTQGAGHGVWIPDLAAPFDTGLVRVSVTVVDHGALLNLNAHGNDTSQEWRLGYFVSDVDPSEFGFEVQQLLSGKSQVPGLWGADGIPGNRNQMAAVPENPGKYMDNPFTLDEEFELRRLMGTFFQSRLEAFAGSELDSDPQTATPTRTARRLGLTTVSWTAEVRPDHETRQVFSPAPGNTWSPRKIDLNLDDPVDIKNALKDGYVFDEADDLLINQFVANVCAYREGNREEEPVKQYAELGGAAGASRQPIFSKIEEEHVNAVENNEPVVKWTIRVQIISPWPGSVAGDTQGLKVANVSLSADGGSAPDPDWPPVGERMPAESGGKPNPLVYEFKVTTKAGELLVQKLKGITLRAAGKVIDRISEQDINDLEDETKLHRRIYIEDEKRYAGDPEPVRVVCIGPWQAGLGAGGIGGFIGTEKPNGLIPIRFPRSVYSRQLNILPEYGLPPYCPSGGRPSTDFSYRAFARLGDLNHLLCPRDNTDAQDFWPWVPRVAAAAADSSGLLAREEQLKFNWNDIKVPGLGMISRMNAANIFCVTGPWLDRVDNDGDGYCDEDGGGPAASLQFVGADEGRVPTVAGPNKAGRFGGPELRVAGRINLNTAPTAVLDALERGFGFSSGALADQVRRERPLWSPAQILRNASPVSGIGLKDAIGELELRDLIYTRLSNLATVRSDVFSIYGTVQFGRVTGATQAAFRYEVVRSRRFWALVDRSPCLAYNPRHDDFIRPRVLNFQWME